MASTPYYSWRAAILKSDLPPSTKLTLLVLSCHMTPAGENCYPTIRQLAEETGHDERTVRRAIQLAREKEWVHVAPRGDRGQRWRNHVYSPLLPDGVGTMPPPSAKGAGIGSAKVRAPCPTSSSVSSSVTTTTLGRVNPTGADFDHKQRAAEVLEVANKFWGTRFRSVTPAGELSANGRLVVQLLKAGYTTADIKRVAVAKSRQWGDDEKMKEFLRPKTVFAKTNFENYLGKLEE